MVSGYGRRRRKRGCDMRQLGNNTGWVPKHAFDDIVVLLFGAGLILRSGGNGGRLHVCLFASFNLVS